jgi:hypothetical protein
MKPGRLISQKKTTADTVQMTTDNPVKIRICL